MLLGLMDGRALTATELAQTAGITKQTASSHLSKMLNGGLVAKEVQGRHHYYRLRDHTVALAIEALLNVSEVGTGARTRTGPRDPALRKARVCYDHLAGELGVFMFDRLISKGWVEETKHGGLTVSQSGWIGLAEIGLNEGHLKKTRRPQCRSCLDWSKRRRHLAGQVGALIMNRLFEMKWAKRLPNSRIVQFTASGESSFEAWLK